MSGRGGRWACAAVALTACVEVPEVRRVAREFDVEAGVSDTGVADMGNDAASCGSGDDACGPGDPVQVWNASDLHVSRLVVAVDCGASMDEAFDGDVTRREAAGAAVGALLDRDLAVEIGLVLFDGRIRRVAPVDRDATQEDIRAALAVHGVGTGRDWSLAVRAARDLLDEAADRGPGAGAVVVLTDGRPDAPEEGPVEEAERVRAETAASVFLVGLAGGDDPAFERVAGSAARVYEAPTVGDLASALTEALPAALPCGVGPLVRAPGDSERVYLSTRPGPGERESPVPRVSDPADRPGAPGFTHDPSTQGLRLSRATCDAVRDGAELVVRLGP